MKFDFKSFGEITFAIGMLLIISSVFLLWLNLVLDTPNNPLPLYVLYIGGPLMIIGMLFGGGESKSKDAENTKTVTEDSK